MNVLKVPHAGMVEPAETPVAPTYVTVPMDTRGVSVRSIMMIVIPVSLS